MMTDNEVYRTLARINRLDVQRRHLEKEIDDLVGVLKSPGLDGQCAATWDEIGAALGLTRQGAQQRYRGYSWQGHLLDPPDPPAETRR